MKTASAIIKYESINNLEDGISRLDRLLARINSDNSMLMAGRRINRTTVLSTLHSAENQLRDYREMVKGIKKACEAEEDDLEDVDPLPSQQPRSLPANVVLFRQKNRRGVTI